VSGAVRRAEDGNDLTALVAPDYEINGKTALRDSRPRSAATSHRGSASNVPLARRHAQTAAMAGKS
jgi:hypothetical protein